MKGGSKKSVLFSQEGSLWLLVRHLGGECGRLACVGPMYVVTGWCSGCVSVPCRAVASMPFRKKTTVCATDQEQPLRHPGYASLFCGNVL